MNPPIYSSRACRSGLPDQPAGPANSTELPASVLEPLHAKGDSPSTNPFGDYDAHENAQRVAQGGGACTAFASASDRASDGRNIGNATMLYPEGLPKFLGLLRPTMTFGVGHSTLSRGMDFIAHFVAITTLVFFSGVIIAISWMQKVCLPIVRHWNHNCTLGFGAVTVLLAVFSWRSAANFDLRRSKVFLFLLGWRLHLFLFLSLLMALGLVLRPQLHTEIKNSVRACVLERNGGEVSPFPSSVSTVSVSGDPSHAESKDGHPLLVDMSNEKGEVGTSLSIIHRPFEDSVKTFAEKREGKAVETTARMEGYVSGDVENPSVPLANSARPTQNAETPAVSAQQENVRTVHDSTGSSAASGVNLSSDRRANARNSNESRDDKDRVVTANAESQGASKADSVTGDHSPIPAAATAFSRGAAGISPSSEGSSQTDAKGMTPQSQTGVDDAATAPPRQDQKTQEAVDPKRLFEGQKLALEAAQRSAVQELNAIVVVILVVASVALLFEFYLVYACWSFKVWLERGYESVVLAGTPPFSAVDGGNGWLAYAMRMPQTVQMETYGNDARGSGRLPLFVQTTDTSDFTAHLGLPITGRW